MRIVPKAVYDVGDAPWVKVTFRDTNGIATDPSSVTAAISRPSGVVDSYSYGVDAELVRLGSGVYRIRVSLGEAGEWVVRMAGVGVVESAAEMLLRVQASGVLDPPVDPEDAGYPSVAWSQITGVPTTIFLPAPHSHPATDITTGVFADARIAASNVTQHQAALSIATTQLTGVLQAAQFPALTGDVTSVAGALATTLASTAVTAGSYGSASQVPTYTVDAKGRLTTAANVAIAIATSQVTSGTFADARIAASNVTQHQASLSIAWGQLTSVPSTFTPSSHTHPTSDIVSGTFSDARISQSSVTQHQSALSIATSQVTGTKAGATFLSDYATAFVNSLTGTANQITVSAAAGAITISIPTNPTLPGTTTGTFSGNLTGNVTGNVSGTAATITGALALANTPLTTRGDLLVATTATPILGRLAKGTQYQVLTGGATDPTWGAVDLAQASAVTGTLPLGNGGTGATTLAGAGIVAGSASITTANALLIGASAGTLGQSDATFVSGVLTRAGTVGLAATGANSATIATNGTTRVSVGSSGTTQVSGLFTVVTSAAAVIAQRWTDSTNYTADFGYKASGQAYFGGYIGTVLYLRADNTDYAAITAIYGLDVIKSGSSGTLRVYDQTATTGVTRSRWTPGAGQSTIPMLASTTGTALTFGVADVEYMRVSSGGKIGIFTTPLTGLHVNNLGSGTITPLASEVAFGVLFGDSSTAASINIGIDGGNPTWLQARTKNSSGAALGFNINPLGGNVTIAASGASIGFFGVTPVVRQTATDLATVLTALANLGLIN